MIETSIGFPTSTIIIFCLFVLVGVILDLYAHKSNKAISLKDATIWTIFWIFLSIIFGIFLYFNHGSEASSLFFTGYILEKALSVDNLFVFMAIFSWFSVPEGYRHRILYWGIIGAIFFRLIFVAIGTSLLTFGPWIEIIFGLIVAWTAYIMLKSSDSEEIEDYSKHIAYKSTHKIFNVSRQLHGNNFFVVRNHILYATPLFLCLIVIEVSDVMFAFDSVPAVIAVTKDPLIVYSAMIFAILGLRTMYFLLEALKKYFTYLEKAVILVLFFISFKLILNSVNHLFEIGYSIHYTTSLYVVLSLLSGSILMSVIKNKLTKGV